MHFNCVDIYMPSHWPTADPTLLSGLQSSVQEGGTVSYISLTLIDFNQPQDMRLDDGKDSDNMLFGAKLSQQQLLVLATIEIFSPFASISVAR